MKFFAALLLFVTLLTPIQAQVGGNQLYGKDNYYRGRDNDLRQNSFLLKDSILTIQARVMLNNKPNYYLVTLGVSQEGATIKKALQTINKRISDLQKEFRSIGLKQEDVYVDFISQNKIYDYLMTDDQAKQVETGFEVKKNIILKIEDLRLFDQIIETASNYDVYDIIKVDYRNNDLPLIYNSLYLEAMNIIGVKKELLIKTNKVKLLDRFCVSGESFYTKYPDSQYSKYEAFESSNVNISRRVVQELRKSSTFYYNGVAFSGFDKVIGADSPEVGIQYILEISVAFELKK